MDVALSPDSSEGKALMDYLRSQGIPSLAFHYAVAVRLRARIFTSDLRRTG
ncbi:MAG TPA: hypothetical protein VN937_14575 [Blastocatellia bacterium]|nr:hypothetical protein [Blastocatellia bacterium]